MKILLYEGKVYLCEEDLNEMGMSKGAKQYAAALMATTALGAAGLGLAIRDARRAKEAKNLNVPAIVQKGESSEAESFMIDMHSAMREAGWTSWEIDMLERVIMAEARGEGKEGQMAVAQVIYDRLHDKNFKNNLDQILRGRYKIDDQGERFTDEFGNWARLKEFADPMAEGTKILDSVREAIYEVFVLGKRLFNEPVHYFHAADKWNKNIQWIKNNAISLGKIGNHIFYKMPEKMLSPRGLDDIMHIGNKLEDRPNE